MSWPKPYNRQNIPDSLRHLWLPRVPCNVLLGFDYVGIEAALVGFFAHDSALTEVALDPARDIHAINCANWYGDTNAFEVASWNGVSVEQAQEWLLALVRDQSKAAASAFKIPYQGEMKDARYATKRGTHGVGYGMKAPMMQRKFGWALRDCERKIELWKRRWPAAARWQDEVVEEAARRKMLDQPFGRIRYFWSPPPKPDKYGQVDWTKWADRNEALALRPASTGASMLKRVMLTIPDGILWGSDHDSITLEVPPTEVSSTARWVRRVMEQRWSQMKWPPYYPDGFWCRVEVRRGVNWRDMEEIEV